METQCSTMLIWCRHCSWCPCISINSLGLYRTLQNCASIFSTCRNIPPTWKLPKLLEILFTPKHLKNRSFFLCKPPKSASWSMCPRPTWQFIGDLNLTSNWSVLQQSSHLLDQFAATQAHTQRTQIGFLRSILSILKPKWLTNNSYEVMQRY